MSTKLTAEQSALVEKWYPRVGVEVTRFCSHFKGSIADRDGIESAMVDGLINVISKNQEGSDQYIIAGMWNAAKDHLRKENTQHKYVETSSTRVDNSAIDGELWGPFEAIDVRDSVNNLPKNQKEVLEQVIYEGRNLTEVSGCPKGNNANHRLVKETYCEAIEALREEYE